MNKRIRSLPSLDLLRGFEASARHLSFTLAAEELFVTQSAISRQVKTLEEHLGITLFQRRNRALFLTEEGEVLYRTTADVLAQLEATTDKLCSGGAPKFLGISTTVSFAAMWLIPRLGRFRARHPEIDVRVSATSEVQDIKRERLNLSIRYARPGTSPLGAKNLFSEEVFAVCSESLQSDPHRPLKKPSDLRKHVLLHMDDACGDMPWFSWATWLEAMGVPNLQAAGSIRFNHYDQMIQAAADGQGVALGRNPLIENMIRQKRLVAPFGEKASASGGYFIVCAPDAEENEDLRRFVAWLVEETEQAAY
jgi:DNA-binding transcriptional LysR family regulator